MNGCSKASGARARASRAHRPACYRCFKPKVTCICASIEPVANRTGVIILQHPRERFHPIGTARIAELGLANVRLEPCTPWTDHSAIAARIPDHAALLYPAQHAREVALLDIEERPRHLVVIDGTWFHAKKIYDAHEWLRALPRVSLAPRGPSLYGIRRQPRADCIATLEAIVEALRILEPRTTGLDRLLDAFSAMVERQASRTPARSAEPRLAGPSIQSTG